MRTLYNIILPILILRDNFEGGQASGALEVILTGLKHHKPISTKTYRCLLTGHIFTFLKPPNTYDYNHLQKLPPFKGVMSKKCHLCMAGYDLNGTNNVLKYSTRHHSYLFYYFCPRLSFSEKGRL